MKIKRGTQQGEESRDHIAKVCTLPKGRRCDLQIDRLTENHSIQEKLSWIDKSFCRPMKQALRHERYEISH